MSTIPNTGLTADEYLVRERAAELRSEFHNGRIIEMPPASFRHALIKAHLAAETGNQLESNDCCVLTSEMRVKTPVTGSHVYPDIVIVCGAPNLQDSHQDTLLNPQVIIEVLSDATEAHDRGFKFHRYQEITSLREYVLVSQNQPLVERFVRREQRSWLLRSFKGWGATFEYASVSARIAMSAIYRNVTF